MPDLSIGSRGTLTIATRGKDGPGEVQVDGGEAFIAHSAEPLPRGTVVVMAVRPEKTMLHSASSQAEARL
jgi:hypothetical protein